MYAGLFVTYHPGVGMKAASAALTQLSTAASMGDPDCTGAAAQVWAPMHTTPDVAGSCCGTAECHSQCARAVCDAARQVRMGII